MKTLFEDLMTGLGEVEEYLAGKNSGYRVHVPEQVDVKNIRKQLQMTQARFSAAFGFSLDAVKHWEGGRRNPEASTRAFLTVISKNPAAVLSALHPVSMKQHRIRTKKEATAKKTREARSGRRTGVGARLSQAV